MTTIIPSVAAHSRTVAFAALALFALSSCADFDMDLRDLADGPDTSAAALRAVADRPTPDARGVLSYPGYQVAVARRGDTVADVAARVGLPASELARFNGAPEDTALNAGEVLALPRRVAEPSSGPIRPAGQVDVATLAGDAIDRADGPAASGETIRREASAAPSSRRVQTGQEPIRHRVTAGETAFSIARRYGVPVAALADWNGLDSDRTVRLGQYLLIPPRKAGSPDPAPTEAAEPAPPGTGSPTPTPPSAAAPLPQESPAPASEAEADGSDEVPASPNLGAERTAASASDAAFVAPVTAAIVRDYQAGENEGLDFAAEPGTAVRAAEAGTVIYVNDADADVRVMVVRHEGNLNTIYANVADLRAETGDAVSRGQRIASVGDAESVFRFQVREGVEAIDPTPYLD